MGFVVMGAIGYLVKLSASLSPLFSSPLLLGFRWVGWSVGLEMDERGLTHGIVGGA